MCSSFTQWGTRTFSFGPFVLVPDRQQLVKGTERERVRIGIRSLEILNALVERAGELVTKNELISRVWPDTFVDESNLKVNVAGLRRALGDCQRGRHTDSSEPPFGSLNRGLLPDGATTVSSLLPISLPNRVAVFVRNSRSRPSGR
jgi:hypothetical protein